MLQWSGWWPLWKAEQSSKFGNCKRLEEIGSYGDRSRRQFPRQKNVTRTATRWNPCSVVSASLYLLPATCHQCHWEAQGAPFSWILYPRWHCDIHTPKAFKQATSESNAISSDHNRSQKVIHRLRPNLLLSKIFNSNCERNSTRCSRRRPRIASSVIALCSSSCTEMRVLRVKALFGLSKDFMICAFTLILEIADPGIYAICRILQVLEPFI